MIGGLNNFNPWGYMPSMGRAGKQANQTLQDLYGGKDYSQINVLKPQMAALNANYANANQMAERNLATGDSAMANSGLQKQQAEQLRNQNANQQGADAANLVAGAYDKAANQYQGALNARRGFGLQASGQALQGKQAGLQGYLDSFRGPTGYSQGIFGKLKEAAGGIGAVAGLF